MRKTGRRLPACVPSAYEKERSLSSPREAEEGTAELCGKLKPFAVR